MDEPDEQDIALAVQMAERAALAAWLESLAVDRHGRLVEPRGRLVAFIREGAYEPPIVAEMYERREEG